MPTHNTETHAEVVPKHPASAPAEAVSQTTGRAQTERTRDKRPEHWHTPPNHAVERTGKSSRFSQPLTVGVRPLNSQQLLEAPG